MDVFSPQNPPQNQPNSALASVQDLLTKYGVKQAGQASSNPQFNSPAIQPNGMTGLANNNSGGATVLNALNGTQGQSPLGMLGSLINKNFGQDMGFALSPDGAYGPFADAGAGSALSQLGNFGSGILAFLGL